MKSIVFRKYGFPETLEFVEMKKPIPKKNEVLVKIKAVSLNAADIDWIKGKFPTRLLSPFKPAFSVLGSDIAGVVEKTGPGVSIFEAGDEIIADLSINGFGGFSEYICLNENILRRKHKLMTFEQASTIPQASLMALQGLRDTVTIHDNDRVLITGAGGGIGSFAVQIAKMQGAIVTAIDSKLKHNMLLKIGVDSVIDYKQTDFAKDINKYDIIMDLVAKHSIFSYYKVLNRGGSYIYAGGKVSTLLQAALFGKLISKTTKKNMKFVVWKTNNEKDMDDIGHLFEQGKLDILIDRVYEFDDTLVALKQIEGGLAKGKVVIRM